MVRFEEDSSQCVNYQTQIVNLYRCSAARVPQPTPPPRWRSRGSTGARVYASLTLILRIRSKQGHWTTSLSRAYRSSPHISHQPGKMGGGLGTSTTKHETHPARTLGRADAGKARAKNQADRTPWHDLRRHMTEESRITHERKKKYIYATTGLRTGSGMTILHGL